MAGLADRAHGAIGDALAYASAILAYAQEAIAAAMAAAGAAQASADAANAAAAAAQATASAAQTPPQGPAADDVAAAALNIPIGQLYYTVDGAVRRRMV
jgi:septal ring factor EnvC (AmiA/AmiB activator)